MKAVGRKLRNQVDSLKCVIRGARRHIPSELIQTSLPLNGDWLYILLSYMGGVVCEMKKRYYYLTPTESELVFHYDVHGSGNFASLPRGSWKVRYIPWE